MLWQKFAILSFVGLTLASIPSILYVKEANKNLEAAVLEREGQQSVAVILKVVQLTQQHRGLSALVLGGVAAAQGKREAKQTEADQAYAAMSAIAKDLHHKAIDEAWNKAQQDWETLRANVSNRSITVPQSYQAHTALVPKLLVVNDLVADHYGLSLDPDLDSYQLIQSMYYQLPYLTEELDKMRAKGAGLLAAKELGAMLDDKISGLHMTRWLMLATLLGLIGLAGLILYLIARSVSVPLANAVAIAQRVAQGDLTPHFDITGNSETAQLLRALKEMNDSLMSIVGNVRVIVNNIDSASTDIASGNADLSARTESQASSLEETASSMEQITSTIKQNADNAKQANLLVVSASAVATKGGQVVSQVVQTMGAINDSSRKIVDIIGVIDGIAFQTNILALKMDEMTQQNSALVEQAAAAAQSLRDQSHLLVQAMGIFKLKGAN